MVNAGQGGRHFSLTANGRVNLGRVDNSDQDSGGNAAGNVNIKASVIEIGGVDTRAMRSPSGSQNGSVVLQALGAPAFDPNQAASNTWYNSLSITGAVQALGTVGGLTSGGHVTLQGVVVRLQPGFSLQQPGSATLILDAGIVRAGAAASDLFVDAAGSGLTASHVVQWSGDIQPTMTIARAALDVLVSWNGDGFILQTNSNLANPAGWADVPSVTSPATLPAAAEAMFFRVRK